jgi:hypothetical protein
VAVSKNLENDGLSLIVRKVFTMENTQPTKTKSGPESQVDTSDASTRSALVAATENSESMSSSQSTIAATPKGSKKTWKSAELAELLSKAGLVAGALADFQAAGGLVAAKNIEYKSPSGSTFTATKLYLVAEGANLTVQATADGLDFNLVAVDGESGQS